MKRTWLVALALISCTTDQSEWDTDLDGVPNYNDCAPNDATIYPGAEEQCDGVDNNCNTRIDEGISTVWYLDNDGDGFAGAANPVESCSRPANGFENALDCNDLDEDINPMAVEICDGLDNNCDNAVDPDFIEEDFEFVESGTIELRGEAEVRDDGDDNRVLQLTGFTQQEKGAVWFRTEVPGDLWEARFTMEMSREDDGGEGIAFVFKPNTKYRTLGPSGPGLGIYGEDEDGWVVEFDAQNNLQGGNDVNASPHVALAPIRDMSQVLQSDTNPPEFRGEGNHFVTVRMNAGQLTVRLDSELVINKFIDDYDPTAIYTLGMTSSTSIPYQQAHEIDNVSVFCPDVAN